MYHATIRTLWGLAKSPELHMSEEDLHAYLFRETGKTSMKELSQAELDQIARLLGRMKDGGPLTRRRTDVGGNPATVAQRRKIYMLTAQLAWNNDNRRVNAFVKKVVGVERLEWLTQPQCSAVIEALKDMVERSHVAHTAAQG